MPCDATRPVGVGEFYCIVSFVLAVALASCGPPSVVLPDPGLGGQGETVIGFVSIPCPAGFTAAQCLDIDLALAGLRMAGETCEDAADRFDEAIAEDEVLYDSDQGYFGESYKSGSTWLLTTTITELNWNTAEDPVTELMNTIAHESFGHQIANGNEDTAEFWGEFCAGIA